MAHLVSLLTHPRSSRFLETAPLQRSGPELSKLHDHLIYSSQLSGEALNFHCLFLSVEEMGTQKRDVPAQGCVASRRQIRNMVQGLSDTRTCLCSVTDV